jgi:hypothetical protein
MSSKNPPAQLLIDFEYDARVATLATELAIMMQPHLSPVTSQKVVVDLAARMALLASKRVNKFEEPKEPMRCHTCDVLTSPSDRVRVVVCNRCGLSGGSAGCSD